MFYQVQRVIHNLYQSNVAHSFYIVINPCPVVLKAMVAFIFCYFVRFYVIH